MAILTRSESKLVLIPGSPSAGSVNRWCPATNSRMMSSAQNSLLLGISLLEQLCYNRSKYSKCGGAQIVHQ